jgi:hypothetical protein
MAGFEHGVDVTCGGCFAFRLGALGGRILCTCLAVVDAKNTVRLCGTFWDNRKLLNTAVVMHAYVNVGD